MAVASLKQEYGFSDKIPNKDGKTPKDLLKENKEWNDKSKTALGKAYRDYNRPRNYEGGVIYDYHRWVKEHPVGSLVALALGIVTLVVAKPLFEMSEKSAKAFNAVNALTQKTVVKTKSDMDRAFLAFREAVADVTAGDIKSVQKLDSVITANGIKAEVYGMADSTSVSYDANKHSILLNSAYEKGRKENIVTILRSIQNNPNNSLRLDVK